MRIAIIGCGEVGGAGARVLKSKGRAVGAGSMAAGLRLRDCGGAGRGELCGRCFRWPFLAEDSIYVDVSTGAPDCLKQSATLWRSSCCAR